MSTRETKELLNYTKTALTIWKEWSKNAKSL